MNSIDRAKIATNSTTDAELARFLGVANSAIGGYYKRAVLPLEQCIKVAEQTGVTLDWLITGNGEMRPNLSLTPEAAAKYLPVEQQMLLTGWASLDKDKQDYIFALLFQVARGDASVWPPKNKAGTGQGDTTINIAGDVGQSNGGDGVQNN